MLLLISLFLISNTLHAATIATTPQNTCERGEYLCEDGTCIPIPWMCDGYEDCPNSEDELFDVCGVPCYSYTTTTTTTVPVSFINCGQSYQDIAPSSGSMTFSFTLPASYSKLKISTCHTENEGAGYFTLCQTQTSAERNCVFGAEDADCITAGCRGRPLILATVGGAVDDISADTEYTLTYYPYFSGTYKFTVECGGSALTGGITGGGTCVDPTHSPDFSSTYDYYYYYYPNPPNPSSTDSSSQQSSTYDYYGYPDPANPSSTDSGSQSNTYDYYGYYQQTNYNGNPGVTTTTMGSYDEPTCDPTMGPTPPTASPVPSSPPVKRPTNPNQDTDDLTNTTTHIGGGRHSASVGLKPNSAIYAALFVIVIYKIFY